MSQIDDRKHMWQTGGREFKSNGNAWGKTCSNEELLLDWIMRNVGSSVFHSRLHWFSASFFKCISCRCVYVAFWLLPQGHRRRWPNESAQLNKIFYKGIHIWYCLISNLYTYTLLIINKNKLKLYEWSNLLIVFPNYYNTLLEAKAQFLKNQNNFVATDVHQNKSHNQTMFMSYRPSV